MIPDTTPVIIGVGQIVDRLGEEDFRGLSPVALAAAAAERALADAGAAGPLAGRIDMLAGVRQFEISTPMANAPFGRADNFPRAVARRLGADPKQAVLEIAGGQSPQHLVTEMAGRIAAGEIHMALLVGAEAISTARALSDHEPKPDWSETVGGQLEDRGFGLKGLISRAETSHQITSAPLSYALLENARRGDLHLSRDAYAQAMAELFAPFTEVAACNPYATAPTAHSAAELVQVDADNRMIAEPYRRRMVSRDQVNQGAAVLLASVGEARALGVPEARLVYLHGHADTREKALAARPELGRSPAAVAAVQAALEMAGIGVGDLASIDLYSCFPIAVFNMADGLGLKANDPRGLTVTGGLPYFGGAGNNYSMHAIATLVERLRMQTGEFGLVGANGGILSKYSAGVYSTKPIGWTRDRSAILQARLDMVPDRPLSIDGEGQGRIVTYSIGYSKGEPAFGVILAERLDGTRFFALTPEEDRRTLRAMLDADPLEREVSVRHLGYGNRFAFDPYHLAELYPQTAPRLRDDYQFVKIDRRDRVLEITLNRPDQRNALHPPAHEELQTVFDAYFADPDLWVAIITGAGEEAFCTGNDIKYRPDGRGIYSPKDGWAGITSRSERNKPVIAAVNGFAMGGGLELALACDLLVADAKAQLALSEVKVGVIAGAGGIVRLPRQIPRKIALEMILTGRRMGLDEALRYGLVNRAAEAGRALETARELAGEILQGSPSSVRLSLQYLRETEGYASEIDGVRHSASAIDELLISADMMEGFRAFAAKRKPEWTGR